MLEINYIELFKNFPPHLAIFLMSMMPIAELRVSIPLALNIYKFSIWSTLFYASMGAFVPALFILYLIEPASEFLMKHSKFFHKFFLWLFRHTKIRFEGKYARYGSLALIIFVAIPLPLFGVWTGALAAFLFQFPKKKAIFLIFLGTVISGLIITSLVVGATHTLNLLK
ncbi:MAG: small multi-drug export protein [Candidatus Parcubacteria bacterium]|nr:small multi-drug export protein [Candidatus Parcubacteria bacterium]